FASRWRALQKITDTKTVNRSFNGDPSKIRGNFHLFSSGLSAKKPRSTFWSAWLSYAASVLLKFLFYRLHSFDNSAVVFIPQLVRNFLVSKSILSQFNNLPIFQGQGL